jgi:hypothetical protein
VRRLGRAVVTRGTGDRGFRSSLRLGLVLGLVLVFSACLAATASAGTTRPYTGVSFGPDGVGGTESFSNVQSITVDQGAEDIYVYDTGGGGRIYKFNPAGAPVAFGGLGGANFIGGVGGAGGGENQVAVAPAGSPGTTAGDIYVANNSVVKVYSSEGVELGSLGVGETCGVAVDPAGHLFIGTYPSTIREYVPATNPPTNTDLTATGTLQIGVCNVAADGAGNVYGVSYGGAEIGKLEGIADTSPSIVKPGGPTVGVDPVSNQLYVDQGGEVAVYGSDLKTVGAFGGEQFSASYGVAVDHASDEAYVGAGTQVQVFGPNQTVPDATTSEASEVTPSTATINGEVNPQGVTVEECFFEYGETTAYGEKADCEAPAAGEIGTGTAPVTVHADIHGLAKQTSYHFRLVVKGHGTRVKGADRGFATPSTVVTKPANPIDDTTAALNGLVYPNELQFTECKFEYGLAGHKGFESEVACTPAAASISPGTLSENVSAALSGLQVNSVYRFRLSATNSAGTIRGAVLTFKTGGAPLIENVRASNADQSSVTIEADINPQGSPAGYYFEWGPTSSYGNRVPAAETQVGSGSSPVHVSARLTGLDGASTYHYRVVASSERGPAASVDHELETLNACGLPEGRCLELVSPRDIGPVAIPGEFSGSLEVHFQAASRPGAFAYTAETGAPDATKGAEVTSRALRGADGWASTQLSPPLTARNETTNGGSSSSEWGALSEELSCGVLTSNQPLTSDPGIRLALETGGVDLFRQNPDGTYTAISSLPPENPEAENGIVSAFNVDGISQNCGKVIFTTGYRYPGVEAAGAFGFPVYEWDEGDLRGLSYVPAPGGGEVLVDALTENYTGAVSADGSRVDFTAARATSPNPEEIGAEGVFVRENGDLTRDVSESETSVPDRGAVFQDASSDGSRVFFTANAGLTAESSPEGQDLYEYDLETESLTDLSVGEEEGGAAVVGLIGASDDGTHVYFLARGQLVAGFGGTFAENEAEKRYSVYSEAGGEIAYVGAVREGYPRHNTLGQAFEEGQWRELLFNRSQTARISPEGQYLLFESSLDLTGYESGNGVREAYLFNADATTEPLVCVSCRQDGKPSASPGGNRRVSAAENPFTATYAPRSLVVRSGRPIVFFDSFDELAPGGVDRSNSVYEWTHGQVFHIATEPPGLNVVKEEENGLRELARFVGASADGTDLYFLTPQTMTWEDGDNRNSIYDARIGGGFAEPAPAAAPCDATAEGACPGPGESKAAAPSPASAGFVGPGNPKQKHHKKRHHKQKHHKQKHHKKKHHKKKHHKKKKGKKKHANGNRRTGK